MSNMKIDGFEMCKAQNGQVLEFQEGLNIVVFLDSLLERKSLRPLDCLLNWKEEFQMLGIPVGYPFARACKLYGRCGFSIWL